MKEKAKQTYKMSSNKISVASKYAVNSQAGSDFLTYLNLKELSLITSANESVTNMSMLRVRHLFARILFIGVCLVILENFLIFSLAFLRM